MSVRLEMWTPLGAFVKRRGRDNLSSRQNLVFGTYEPLEGTHAGLIPGTEDDLVDYTGPFTITTPGTLIEGKDCHGGYFDIRAANVTIRNSRIRGGTPPGSGNTGLILATHANCVNLTIEDSHLIPDTPSPFVDGVRGHDFTLKRSIVENCTDCCGVFRTQQFGVPTNVSILGNVLRKLSFFWGVQGVVHPSDNKTHNDLVQIHGGHNTLIQGNTLDCRYSREVGHAVPPYATVPPADASSGGSLPDRGSGTEATGRFNWGSLIAVQYNTGQGTTEGTQVLDNYIYGASIPINVGINTNNAGKIWRNKFSRDQGQQSSGGDATYTVNIKTGTTCDAGEGTANQNTYMDNGHAVTVRRNG